MIKRNLLFILCSILLTAGFTVGQTRTVTNADLADFREKRLAAERDLRENYEKLGFPSPAELEKQYEQDRVEREKLAEKLRRERLAREQIERDQSFLEAQSSPPALYFVRDADGSGGNYYRPYSSYFVYTRDRYNRRSQNYNVYLPGGGYFGPTFNPQQGVRINTRGIQINTVGPTRRPVRIRTPR